jgi:ABC-2 type transport system permease protein
MRDALLVARKELAELFSVQAGRRAQLLTMGGQVAVFGFLLPYFMAPAWIGETSVLSFIFLLLPMALSFSLAAASFAGERERRTLESLLATPLSVSAMFFGKSLAGLVQVYSMVVSSTLLSLVALNLWGRQQGLGQIFIYSGPALFALLGLSMAVAVFATSCGVIISLKAPSVRVAQTTTTFLSVLCLLPLMVGWIVIEFTWPHMAAFTLSLAAIDAAITALALARFSRAASISARG